MKKFQLQSLFITINNKKINVLSLKNNSEDYYLYVNNSSKSGDDDSINDANIDTRFGKIENNETFSITPKKKMNDLKISVKFNDKQKKYFLFLNNKKLYFIKNKKNIIIDDDNYKIVQSNGTIFQNESKSLVDSILNNAKSKDLQVENSIKIIKTIVEDNYSEPLKIEKNNLHNPSNFIVEDVSEDSSDDEEETIIQINKEFKDEPIIEEIVVEQTQVSEPIVEETAVSESIVEQIQVSEPIVEEIQVSEAIIEETKVSEPIVEDTAVSESIVEETAVSESIVEETPVFEAIVEETPVFEAIVEEISIPEPIAQDIVLNNKEVSFSEEEFKEKSSKILFDINKRHEESNKIVEENIDKIIYNKNIIDENISKRNDLNLEKIINDFNKLFTDLEVDFSKENIETKMQEQTQANKKKEVLSTQMPNKRDPTQQIIEENKKQQITYQLKTFNYQYINYTMYYVKLSESLNLNFANLYQSTIPEINIINNINLCIEFKTENLSYLILFLNQKYLINKIDNSITLINLNAKKAQILKNKDIFKIGNYDYMLYNNCTIFIPMLNKTNFDNNYGTSFNYLIPRI